MFDVDPPPHYSNRRRDDIDPIVEGLYLSSVDSVTARDGIKRHGITHVITVMDEPISEKERIKNVNYHFIKASDIESQDLLRTGILHKAVKLIEECLASSSPCGGGVLVHCQAGISRSPTIVAAYLMKTKRLTANEALKFIAQNRPIIWPNDSFLRQLDEFEKILRAKGNEKCSIN